MFAAIDHAGAVERTRVVCGHWGIPVGTALCVAEVVAAVLLLLALQLALEEAEFLLAALDLSNLVSAHTVLVSYLFAGRAGSLMAAVGAAMPAI